MRQQQSNLRLSLSGSGAIAVMIALAFPLAAQSQHAAVKLATNKTKPTLTKSKSLGHCLKDSRENKEERDQDIGLLTSRTGARSCFARGEDGNEETGEYEALMRWLFLRTHPYAQMNWSAYQAALDKVSRATGVNPGNPTGNSPKGPSVLALNPPSLPLPLDPKALTGVWKFVGPTNLAPGPQLGGGVGPVSGRVSAVAYDPSNTRTFYLGSPSGGAWKTTDGGVTWKALLDTQANLSVSSIVIDPNNSSVLYIGTGDYDGGILPGYGILKSTDGGATWTNLDPDHSIFGTYAIRKILIDPSSRDPLTGQSRNIIVTGGLFANGGKLFRTMNSGGTWSPVLSVARPFENVVYNSDRSALYASADRLGIFKSTDNGVTWNGPLAGAATTGGRIDVAASQIDANTVYVLDGSARRVNKSLDGGATWRGVTGGPLRGEVWGQANTDFYIACTRQTIAPTGAPAQGTVTTDAVYVGLLGIYQSPDGGNNWFDATLTNTGSDLAHIGQHAIAFNPLNSNDALIANEGGVYRMTYAPNSSAPFSYSFHFVSLNRNLGVTQFYSGATSPVDGSQLLGGAKDNGTPHADGDLANWKNRGTGTGAGSAINISDPFNRNVALRGVQNQYLALPGDGINSPIFVTENDWATRENISLPAVAAPEFTLSIPPLVLHNNNQLFAYTATQFLYQYTHPALTDNPAMPNTNTSWTKFGQDFRGTDTAAPGYNAFDSVNAIGTDPNNIANLYVGTTDGKFWISKDQGGTFIRADQPDPLTGGQGMNGLPRRPITSIIVSPTLSTRGRRVWVTLAGAGGVTRVWTSNNANDTVTINGTVFSTARWSPVGGSGLPDLPTYTMVVLPHEDEQAMYIGNDAGVFFSSNGGTTWQDAGVALGLPRVIVTQLVFSPGTGYLQAFSFGRGVWRIVAGNDVPINIYPNLQGYRGDRSKLKATIEFSRPGSTAIIDTRQLNLTSAGWISTSVSFQGSCDIYIRVPGFLNKRIRGATTNNGSIITSLILAGDVNNVLDRNGKVIGYGDNVINGTDLAAVNVHMNQFWTGPEDIDGDGRVTINDVNILTGNLGKLGDP